MKYWLLALAALVILALLAGCGNDKEAAVATPSHGNFERIILPDQPHQWFGTVYHDVKRKVTCWQLDRGTFCMTDYKIREDGGKTD